MNISNSVNWLHELPEKIVAFTKQLKSTNLPGYYRYSYSGDCFDERCRWGLGNAVFAAKILFMLDAASFQDSQDISRFINSFQDSDGYFSDPLVMRQSRVSRWGGAFKRLDFNNLFNQQTVRAESRQAFAALQCLNVTPLRPFTSIPETKESIARYLHGLNWKQPWNAGSHVSHLLFFLHANHKLFSFYSDDSAELVKYVVDTVNCYRQKDGSWYDSRFNLPDNHKVNSAMKVLTGFEAAGISAIDSPEALIDLCLRSENDGHACNNFNIIYVLYRCASNTDYKKDEISNFCINRLQMYKRHYHAEYGGFSFYENHANPVYYAARITRGLPEPDIHGTILFLWGIALISRILDLPTRNSIRLPIT